MAGLKEFLFLSVVIPHFLWLSFSVVFWWLVSRMALYTKDLRVHPVSISHLMAHLHKYPGRD